jgi:purine-binding chemotaxis protein CheW
MRARRARTTSGKNLVAFEVGGICYALPLQRVREIVRPAPVLALPHVPGSVIGVVDHRGDVLPIIDLRKRFAVAQSGRDKDVRWIIVTRADRKLGLVVDRVTEVFGVSDAQRREPPEIGTGAQARGITAAYSHREQLVFVLDADELTSVADQLDLPQGPVVASEAQQRD